MTKLLFFFLSILITLPLIAGDHHHDSSGELTLHHGKKWIANQATHVGMTTIRTLVRSRPPGSQAVLAERLSTEVQTIAAKCDMTGKAHEQLHLVFVPLMQEVKSLKNASDQALIEKALAEIERLTNRYFEHFQVAKSQTSN